MLPERRHGWEKLINKYKKQEELVELPKDLPPEALQYMMRRETLIRHPSVPPPPAPPAPPLPLEAVENAGVDRAANEVSVTNHEPAAKPHFVCSPQKRPPLPPAINNMSAAIKARGGGGGGRRWKLLEELLMSSFR